MSNGRRARRLLLIGWDGADPHALKSLLAAGRLPHLKSLVDSGVVLELDSPRPTFPESAWTSLATGKRPHEHGVLHTYRKVGEDSALRPLSRHDRQCSALWNVLGRAGLESHIVGWPVTHPAESFSGICVSDCFADSQKGFTSFALSGPSVTPPGAAQTFIERSMAPHQVEEFTLTQLLPSRAIGSRACAEVESACREILAQTASLFRSIRWCLDTRRWDFAACVFPGIRRCHHLVNRLRVLSPATAELCDPMLTGCYDHHDLLLGQLLSQVDEDTFLMVISPTSHSLVANSRSDSADASSILGLGRAKSGLAVICGPGVNRQAAILPRNLLDITPTILALFGVPFGRDMAGRPLADLFASGLESNAIETWDPPSSNTTSQSRVEVIASASVPMAGTSETQHLSELGYLDPLDVAADKAAVHCERTADMNRAISLLDAGLMAQAMNVLEHLTEEYPDWPVCFSWLVEAYYRAGRYNAARKLIDRLTSHGIENPHLYLLSAAIGIAERQFDRALGDISCARRGKAVPSGYDLLVGSIHLRKHNLLAAEMAFRQAIESNSVSAHALDGMASVKLHWKQYEEAAVFALDALEIDMRLAKAHYHLAVALYFLNKPHEALQALASWATFDPLAAAPFRWMASVHRDLLHDVKQAEACLELGKQAIRRRHSLESASVVGTSEPTFAL